MSKIQFSAGIVLFCYSLYILINCVQAAFEFQAYSAAIQQSFEQARQSVHLKCCVLKRWQQACRKPFISINFRIVVYSQLKNIWNHMILANRSSCVMNPHVRYTIQVEIKILWLSNESIPSLHCLCVKHTVLCCH